MLSTTLDLTPTRLETPVPTLPTETIPTETKGIAPGNVNSLALLPQIPGSAEKLASANIGNALYLRAKVTDRLEIGIDTLGFPRMTITLHPSEIETLQNAGLIAPQFGIDNIAFARAIGHHFPDFSEERLQRKISKCAKRIATDCDTDETLSLSGKQFRQSLAQLVDALRGGRHFNPGSSMVLAIKENSGALAFVSLPSEPHAVQMARMVATFVQQEVFSEYLLQGKLREARDRLARAETYVDEVESMAIQLQHGASRQEVAAMHRIAPSTVKARLEGTLPNGIAHLPKLSRSNGVKAAPVALENCPSSHWAHFLGVFCAMRSTGQTKKRIEFVTKDKELAEKLFETLRKLLPQGSTPMLRERQFTGRTGYSCHVTSVALTTLLNETTGFSSHLPWKHLQTREDKISFLQGYFRVRGNISKINISATRTDNPGLMVELAVLLDEVGITPTVQFDKVTRVTISDWLGLKAFSELGLATSESDKKKLADLLSQERSKVGVSAEDYYSVDEFRRENPNTAERVVGEATGISVNTFRSWYREASVPLSVRRKEFLEQLAEDYEVEKIREQF